MGIEMRVVQKDMMRMEGMKLVGMEMSVGSLLLCSATLSLQLFLLVEGKYCR